MFRNRHLYVNGQEIYLDSDEIIPITKQANNIAELKDRQADFTTDFSIPKTRANIQILEHANLLSSGTVVPYVKNSCTYSEDGIELISDGYLVLMSSDKKYFTAAAYSGNADFFKLIDKLKLSGLNTSDLDHVWDLPVLTDSLASKPDVKYLVFEPGKNGDLYKTQMNFELFRPFISCKRLFRQVFIDQGWTLTGDLDMIDEWLLCPNIKPSTLLCNARARLAQSVTVPSRYVVSNYKVIILENGDDQVIGWDFVEQRGAFTYTYHNSMILAFRRHGTYKVTISGKMMFTGAESFVIDFKAADKGDTNIIASNTNSGIVQDFNVTYELNAPDGAAMGVVFALTNPLPNSSLTIYSAEFTISLNDSTVLQGDTIQVSAVLPDMEQSKFIKSIANQYGLVYQTDSQRREVKVWRFDDLIKNIPLALNWSAYTSKGSEVMQYRIGDYAQQNIMKYKDGDGVPVGYGSGSLSINNATLDLSKDLFDLEFANSVDVVKGGDTMALIPLYEANSEGVFVKSDLNEARVVKYATVNKPLRVTYILTYLDLTTYNLAYFINTAAGDGLGFNYRLSSKYYNALSQILNDCKKIDIKMQLPITEIQGLDHSIPVYIDDLASYFYVNKVSQWQKDKYCTVELIKLA